MTDNPGVLDKGLIKALSFALRHNPWAFGLTVSDEGFASLDAVVVSLLARTPAFRTESAEEFAARIIGLDTERFEIRAGRIRARYGHSFPVHYVGTNEIPPDTLYHGTTHETAEVIITSGIQPMDRYYVHLTSDFEYAARVGTAKGRVCVLQVNATSTHRAGVSFYRANSHVWLSNEIPTAFLMEPLENSAVVSDLPYPFFSIRDKPES